jgi:DNA-binding transcriptional regulator YdaS (Cro superfamily)
MTEVRKLIESLGGAAAVARKIGVSRQAVFQWGDYIPESSAWKLLRAYPDQLTVDDLDRLTK